MSRVIALLVAASLVACGPAWPHHATAITSAELASGAAPVRTIDVLPADLEVWTEPGVAYDAGEVRLALEQRILGEAGTTFYRRGYGIGAVLDWNGGYVDRDGRAATALPPDALLATLDSLASYGTAVGETGALPPAFLPARLGTATGADATLYIGGWGFVGKPSNRGATVGKVIVGTILIIGIVVVIAAVAKSDKLDGLDKVVGGAARAVGNVAVSVGREALRASMRAGSAMYHVGKPLLEDGGDVLLDALGRTATHIQLVSGRPAWSSDPHAPHRGRSRLYLELTLVDNRTGAVLWHAHQGFPAGPHKAGDVTRAVRQLLASLPPAA